jgi:hypothetical protein
MPVILATREAEIRRIQVPSQQGKVCETLSRPWLLQDLEVKGEEELAVVPLGPQLTHRTLGVVTSGVLVSPAVCCRESRRAGALCWPSRMQTLLTPRSSLQPLLPSGLAPCLSLARIAIFLPEAFLWFLENVTCPLFSPPGAALSQ